MPTGSYIRTPEVKEQMRKRALEGKYGSWMKGKTAEKSNNWKGGLPKCKDCGKILSYRKGIRCKKCADNFYIGMNSHSFGVHRYAENSGNWKGGIRNKPEYQREYSKNRRHKLGISKKYISDCNISKTKEYKKLQRQKRKAFIKGSGELTIKTIQQIYEDNIKKFGTLTCYLCLKPILFGKDTLEHKQPISRGGTNKYENLAIACKSCNCRKYNKTLEEFKSYVYLPRLAG